jgi:UDP-N-acetylmuramyl pentapeptide synthase
MNNEPTAVEEKKVGRHQAGVGCHSALRNSPNDEHEFELNVVGSGASAALASDSPRAINSLRDLSLLQVQDTLTKLHKLAPSYRRLMPQRPFSSPVPALNGQTATQGPAFIPGHEFLSDVMGSGVLGASTALASDSPRAINSLRDLSLLQVQDTLTKLHKLAPSYRQLMPQPPSSSLVPTWN